MAETEAINSSAETGGNARHRDPAGISYHGLYHGIFFYPSASAASIMLNGLVDSEPNIRNKASRGFHIGFLTAMHHGNQGDQTKHGLIAGIFAAALFIIAFAWPAYLSHLDIQNEARRNVDRYAEGARKKIAANCAKLADQPRADCEDPINEAARSAQRDELDVAAQKAITLWTAVMGSVAVIGAALSAFGVMLVWTTFDATRKQNSITQDASRAWLKITDVSLTRLILKTGAELQPLIMLGVEIENVGNSPASDVRVLTSSWISRSPSGYGVLPKAVGQAKQEMAGRKDRAEGLTNMLFPQDREKFSCQSNPQIDVNRPLNAKITEQSHGQFLVFGCVAVFYKINSGTQACTIRTFLISSELFKDAANAFAVAQTANHDDNAVLRLLNIADLAE